MACSVSASAPSRIPVRALPDQPRAAASALLVSHIDGDHQFLEGIFLQKQWMLFRSETVPSALSLLRANEVPVVISERDVPGGGWRKILSGLECLPRPPLLVVTSHLADDHLWAEVLNLGGHDVLATPFCAKELLWVLENAWRRFGVPPGAPATAACAQGS